MSETGSNSGNNERASFLAQLMQKLSYTKTVADSTGKSTDSAQAEVLRQIKQATHKNSGNLLSGEGVTKSGNED